MKVGYKKLGLVLGAVAAFALLPATADAQFVRYSPVFWSFEGSGGIAIPMGDLGDVAEAGPSFGLAASYFLNPNFALRGEGSVDFYGEPDGSTVEPDLRVWHFTGGFEYHISDPTENLLFAIDAGVGGVTFDTKVFQVDDFPGSGDTATGSFQKTYLAANGGVKVGYNFARHAQTGTPIVAIFIQGDIHLMFADEDDSAILAATAGEQPFGTVFAIPVTAGLRFNIP
ncbi:MAG: hypothetical protein R3266_07615 [Gemmatimonadota bacterium]|nr:hypothetical protein [Gemmatimonadota bacterium]